tara:strand:- start:146 stop:562 length:417 start_codon:yes stop_codon:yes gene_type:complete
MRYMHNSYVDFLMFENRLEHNFINGHSFRVKLKSGTSVFFCKKTAYVQYDNNKGTMEDVVVKKTALSKYKCITINNDPTMYLRFIHSNNTSVYVDSERYTIRNTINNKDFFEYVLSKNEEKYIDKILSKYYKNNVSCL